MVPSLRMVIWYYCNSHVTHMIRLKLGLFFAQSTLLTGRCYEAALEIPFPMVSLFAEISSMRHFGQISFRTHNSSLEGATEQKICGHFAPLEMPFLMMSLFSLFAKIVLITLLLPKPLGGLGRVCKLLLHSYLVFFVLAPKCRDLVLGSYVRRWS